VKLNSRGKTVLVGLALGVAAGVLIWRRGKMRLPALHRKRALPAPDPGNLGEPGRNTDERLDEAIEESFPASDPVSIRIE
jgi:hypothetical protein